MTTLCKVSLDFFSLGRRMVDVIHICVAMKPIEGGFAQNALKYGVAGINVDGCRIGAESIATRHTERPCGDAVVGRGAKGTGETSYHSGRWPANIILDEEAGALLDEQSGNRKTGVVTPQNISRTQKSTYGKPNQNCNQASYGGEGGASRFFKVIGDEE